MNEGKGAGGRLLLSSFLGELVLDHDLGPLPARVLLRVLGDLGIPETAARSVLARSVDRGMLASRRVGREVTYDLTPWGRGHLARVGARVRSTTPFVPASDGWTLLVFSVPEGRRDARHQLRSRLETAGFRPLRDGVWISPGRRNLEAVLADLDGPGRLEAFHAEAHEITDVAALVARVWDLPRLRAAHEEFLARWEHQEPVDALPALVSMVAEWLQLLLLDPGLPAAAIAPDWPAPRSAATVVRLRAQLGPPAVAALVAQLA